MAESIIDIIQRLSLEVSSKDLDVYIEKLQKEAAVIERLKKSNQQLETARKSAINANEYDRLTASIAANAKQIDLRTTALQKSFNENKKLQSALNEEVGTINVLTGLIKRLKEEQSALTDPTQIKSYTKQIAEAQSQLKSLTTGETKTNILYQILGIGSGGNIGRQLLQGTLYGFGIGGGFGIITRLTDELIKLGEEFLNTEEKEKKFEEATKQLTDSILKQVDAFAQLDNSYQAIYGDEGYNNLKRQLETIKAIGVVDGQIYKSQKDIFDKEQQVRNNEKSQLQNTIDIYTKVQRIIGSGKDIKDVLANPAEFGEGLNTSAIKDISKVVQDAKDKGIDLSSAITDKLIALDQQLKDKSNEIASQEIEFKNKLAEQAYELNRQLLIQSRKDEEQYNIQRLKSYEETIQRINQIIELQRKEEIAQVDDEIDQARKKGILTTQIEEDYARKKADINHKYNLQRIEEDKDFIRKYTAIGDQIERSVIGQQPNILFALLNPSAPDLQQYQQLAEARNKKLLSDYDQFAEQLTQRAIKNEATQEEIDKELADRRQLLIKQTNENIINAYIEYYKQVEGLNNDHANRVISADKLFHDTELANISAQILSGQISPRTGSFLNQRQQIYSRIDQYRNNLGAAQGNLAAATAAYANISNSGSASPEDIQKAQDEINKIQDQIQILSKDLTDEEQRLKNLQTQHIFDQIDQYKQLADAGVAAYEAINAAHQRYLDAQISIQEERVREAEVLAQRGNTTALQQQQELLNKQLQQKALAAKRELVINTTLTLSNEALAIAKAVAEGGGIFSAVTVAAVIASLAAGYAAINSLQSANTPPVGFAEGGYTGEGGKYQPAGIVHKGEFVFNKETTDRYRPLFEAIHHGEIPVLKDPGSASNKELAVLPSKIDELTDAVRESQVVIHDHINERGLVRYIDRAVRKHQQRWI